jgi:hypothetical protein
MLGDRRRGSAVTNFAADPECGAIAAMKEVFAGGADAPPYFSTSEEYR